MSVLLRSAKGRRGGWGGRKERKIRGGRGGGEGVKEGLSRRHFFSFFPLFFCGVRKLQRGQQLKQKISKLKAKSRFPGHTKSFEAVIFFPAAPAAATGGDTSADPFFVLPSKSAVVFILWDHDSEGWRIPVTQTNGLLLCLRYSPPW